MPMRRPIHYHRSTIPVKSQIARLGMGNHDSCSWASEGNVQTPPYLPEVVLTGHYRSGKSSISSVVFHKLPPAETLYLETTTHIKKESMQYVRLSTLTLTIKLTSVAIVP